MLSSSPDLIRCVDVSKTYVADLGEIPALDGIVISLRDGDTLALVGPSGCGKSTLLVLMAGLEKPTTGSIEFQGSPLPRPHRKIALVLQDYGLFPWKTIRDNIELGLKIRGETIDHSRLMGLLGELDILEKTELYPQQLSGGQKQRVALARALVLNPALLLLDEPFASIDTLTRERLQDLVASAWRARGFGLVVVTHNIQEAVGLGRRILIMGGHPGTIVATIDNPLACMDSYRGTPEFYRICGQVRDELERIA